MSNEDDAIDKLAHTIKIAVRGWPIYGVVIGMMWSYSELWLDKKISDAISQKTIEVPQVVVIGETVQSNKEAIGRIEVKVEEVEGDAKAILRHLAGAED